MIIKPSITFLNSNSDSLLIANIGAILTAMTDNLNYPTPVPTLLAIGTALTAFSDALAAASGGGISLTSAKNDRRADLVDLMWQLASYVQIACGGDMTTLLTSGFPVQKAQRQPVGLPAVPAGLAVSLGARSGGIDGAATSSFGASIYNWRVCTAAAPDVVVASAQTTAARASFNGLTPGTIYNVEINAVGSAGASDWSYPIGQMVV